MAVMRFCGSSRSGSEEIGVTAVRGRFEPLDMHKINCASQKNFSVSILEGRREEAAMENKQSATIRKAALRRSAHAELVARIRSWRHVPLALFVMRHLIFGYIAKL